jgi:2-keto-4-pentenoate hydratase/2-oxohepta-3-ene-1,7-dioic acid hydratase in catechol pathway
VKYLSYVYKESYGYGVLNEDETKVLPMDILLNELKLKVPEDLKDFIRMYSNTLTNEFMGIWHKFNDMGIPLSDIKLTSPIPYPRRNIFCLGKNYVEHALEVNSLPGNVAAIPEVPIYFTKVADPSIGHLDNIKLPIGVSTKIDYEVELAVIIGKDGYNIPKEEAEEYIFGYTVGNDITARDIQKRHIQWFKGKSFDTFMPLGPYIVDKTEIKFPVELDISCSVNGELRQSSNTKNLIFDIPYIISDLSKGITLKAGDIILTGTPAGVGMGFNPYRFLKSGDLIECNIEKIGKLINSIE